MLQGKLFISFYLYQQQTDSGHFAGQGLLTSLVILLPRVRPGLSTWLRILTSHPQLSTQTTSEPVIDIVIAVIWSRHGNLNFFSFIN